MYGLGPGVRLSMKDPNGDNVLDSSTPAGLEMEQEDQIDVTVRVVLVCACLCFSVFSCLYHC